MALTAAEKMHRRRQKLKDEGKYDEYKVKQRQHMKKCREKKKEQITKLSKRKQEVIKQEERRKIRERVARYRMLIKERQVQQSVKNSPKVYRSATSLSRAMTRVKSALPKSPKKRKCVVRKLFQSLGLDLEKTQHEEQKQKTVLSEEVKNKVKEFYVRDDISRQAPGLKDVVTVKDSNGVKTKLQARHLFSSIRETHALFCAENDDLKIGKSKFSELRPKHVKLSSKLPHNVCLCKYHENFISAVNSLHNAVPSFPKYSESFWNKFLCEVPSDMCWMGKCVYCKDKLKTEISALLREIDDEYDVKWFVWRENSENIRKVEEKGKIYELEGYINSITDTFREHSYMKREQAKSYQSDRTLTSKINFDPNIALVQVDFSENYTCIAQQEIQSYHWKQPQVSLFTCSICYKGNQIPYVIVSDNLDHTKNTIVAYMSTIFERIHTNIREVRVWSDGPSSQFKNKFIAASLPVLERKHKMKIIWNYFATSHGKGPVDGIGGSVKRQVRQAVLTNKVIVDSALDFYKVTTEVSNVHVIHMSTDEINTLNSEMDILNTFEKSKSITGISKIHAMMTRKNVIQTYTLTKNITAINETSTSTEPGPSSSNLENIPKLNPKRRPSIYHLVYDSSDESDTDNSEPIYHPLQDVGEIKSGCFVLVEFTKEKKPTEKFRYAAICQSDVDESLDVKIVCLKCVENNRLFKVHENDVTYVTSSQIVELLPFPDIQMKGNRMYYRFNKKIDIKEM